jgi:hypothetical protein
MLKLSKNKVNKELYSNTIYYLINSYFEYKKNIKININNEYLTYNCFYPLPTKLIINETEHNIIENNNIYCIKTNKIDIKKKILFGNRILPIIDKDPIPFSFPIIKNNELEIINSNIYYYELTILKNMFDNIENQICCIGYGTIDTIIDSYIGNKITSFGFNLNKGEIIFNKIHHDVGLSCNTNDTIGAGITYISKNVYKPFFTYNGSLIDIDLEYFYNTEEEQLLPIIEFNYSHKIKLNFSQEEFKFDIKNFKINNEILSQKNNFLKYDKKITNIETIEIIKNKIYGINLKFIIYNENNIINLQNMNIFDNITFINA